MFTVLPRKAPFEPSFYDGLAVVLGRPMVQDLFTFSTLLFVLVRDLLLLSFIGAPQMDILQALNLSRKIKYKDIISCKIKFERM